MPRRKTHDEFIFELNFINPNIEVLDTYINNHSKIKCKCKICDQEWYPTPHSLLNSKSGCPVCSNRITVRGINDIWTTNPELASMLANPEDGYIYTQGNDAKVDWKCPECGTIIKNKSIGAIKKRGLSCPKCSDGISYPEKFMYNLLSQLNISFETQKVFKWAKSKKYDFYLKDYNCIIETHGDQHFRDNTQFGKLINIQSNDLIKQNLALTNNVHNYIIIDARESNYNFLKNSIIDNIELNKMLNLDKIDWNKCHYDSLKSLILIACDYWNNGICNTNQISKLMNLHRATIVKYLKTCAEIGLCNYSAKDEIKNNINKINNKYKTPVICVTTGERFDSMKEACDKYNLRSSSLTLCCQGKHKTCGGFLWKYDTRSKKHKRKNYNPNYKQVDQYTLDGVFMKSFNSSGDAEKETGVSSGKILSNCRGEQLKTGDFIWRFKGDKFNKYRIKDNHNCSPINQYDVNGGFIKSYDGIYIACEETGLRSSGIVACCQKRYKTSGGYIWKYADAS